ncbi:MAG: hypothetical protein MI924_01165 [Chloroflexales bacterium]|nr:hypothetical protein [Chloroflexales bacterium]
MRTRMWMVLGGIALALLTTLALAPVTLAQGPANGFTPTRSVMGPRGGGPTRGMSDSLVAVAADVLEMDRTALVAELQSGKTIAQVAEEHNVALSEIVDAFLAPRAERLASLVESGRLTQEQADTMLATMEANVTTRLIEPWSPQGPGAGNGDGICDCNGDGVCRGPRGQGPQGCGLGQNGR